MEVLQVAVLVRGLISILFIGGAGFCVFKGCGLIARHFRRGEPETKFESSMAGQTMSFSTGAAGTAVVLTSVAWVLGAVVAVMSVEQAGDGWRVASRGNHSPFPPDSPDPREAVVLSFTDRSDCLIKLQEVPILESKVGAESDENDNGGADAGEILTTTSPSPSQLEDLKASVDKLLARAASC